MTVKLPVGMLEATRLTRSGRLTEATAEIQRSLRGVSAPHSAAEAPGASAQTALDGEYCVVDADPTVFPAQEGEPPCQSYEASPPSSGHTAASPHAFVTRLNEKMRQHWSEPRGIMPGAEPSPDQAHDTVPDGGCFTSATYTNHAGTRSYKLFVPSGYHGQPLPLVVMLHGCTQDPDDFAIGTRMNTLAEAQLCFVAYPAQTQTANSSKCWNWFKASDQQRDEGEPSIIAGLTRQIVNSHCVDRHRIYVAGLSAGGAMAATMVTTYPDLYAAAGIHSGLPHAIANNILAALTAMQGGQRAPQSGPKTRGSRHATTSVPTIVFHGDRDTTVHPNNGEQVVAQSVPSDARSTLGTNDALRVTVQPGKVPNGHSYTCTTYHDETGQSFAEHWLVHGAGHAWSGGSPNGSYTDPKGPDATREMLRFFYEHPLGKTSPCTSWRGSDN